MTTADYHGTIAHTDGSVQGSKSCAVTLIVSNGRFVTELVQRDVGHTSSDAELSGVLMAARYIKDHREKLSSPFLIYTDSLEVVHGFSSPHDQKTRKKDWAELSSIGIEVGLEVKHIKGHSTGNFRNPNKVCDTLAKTVCGMVLSPGSDAL